MRKLEIIIILIVATIFILGGITWSIANTKCKFMCHEEDAITHKLIPGGGILTIKNDVCICFLPDKTKTFKMGTKYERENK